MHRHVKIKQILEIRFVEKIDIDRLKRFSKPANDEAQMQTDFFKKLLESVKQKGLLDPFFVYNLVNVDLKNAPLYKNREKLYGLMILRGNNRWLVCKQLGIKQVPAVIVTADCGYYGSDAFIGDQLPEGRIITTEQELDDIFAGLGIKSTIYPDHVKLTCASFIDKPERYGKVR